jgi:hypothetical protein
MAKGSIVLTRNGSGMTRPCVNLNQLRSATKSIVSVYNWQDPELPDSIESLVGFYIGTRNLSRVKQSKESEAAEAITNGTARDTNGDGRISLSEAEAQGDTWLENVQEANQAALSGDWQTYFSEHNQNWSAAGRAVSDWFSGSWDTAVGWGVDILTSGG